MCEGRDQQWTSFDEEAWHRFLKRTCDRPPREMLVAALPYVPDNGTACDLSCGAGNEVMEMLRRGMTVTAFDALPQAIANVKQRAEAEHLDARLKALCATFDQVHWPARAYDLVHAGFAIPFCRPVLFDAMWSGLRGSLRKRGVFAGQFFGQNDEWTDHPDAATLSFHCEDDIRRCLQGMEVHHFEEVDRDGEDAFGQPKHWHVFHVIAQDTQANP